MKTITSLIKSFLFLFCDLVSSFRRSIAGKKKKLIIIKVDEIGDYILFRNYLETVRKSKRYQDYKITLCLNIVLKSLALKFDRSYSDKVIFFEKSKFINSPLYRILFLMRLRSSFYNELLSPVYSRSFFIEDELVHATNALIKIGYDGDLFRIKKDQKEISNSYYTHLIKSRHKFLFEFYRNREFFEQVLEEEIHIIKPHLELEKVEQQYIVIFPGANAEFRKWSEKKFATLISSVLSVYNFKCIIAGSSSDKVIARAILEEVNTSNVEDFTGKTTLVDLVHLISHASLLISNETGAAHLAVAVNTPTVCISNGNHYLRFTPYPKEIYNKIITVFPDKMKSIRDNFVIARKYRNTSDLDINEISVDQVYNAVVQILSYNSL